MPDPRHLALLCLAAIALAGGCLIGETTFDPIEYDHGNLTVTVVTGTPIVHADLQVTVAALDGVLHREVFAEARYVDLASGKNRFSYAVDLPDGQYRCYLHLYDGQQRIGAVIRELDVRRATGDA